MSLQKYDLNELLLEVIYLIRTVKTQKRRRTLLLHSLFLEEVITMHRIIEIIQIEAVANLT